MNWNPNQQPAQGPESQQPQQSGPSYGGYRGYGGYGGYGSSQTGPGGTPYYGPAGQQQQQQQYYAYQPPASVARAASVLDPTALKMDARSEALLSYLFWFFSGIFIFLVERRNRFVRFHAAQSILWFGGLTLLFAVVRAIGLIPLLGTIILALPISCATGVILVVGGLSWLFLMIMAYRGSYLKLPVVGDYAERLATLFMKKPAQPVPPAA
uniref:DUF4870 domain-containing protein n=1 Tax=Thermogemmatispora argillosa TaxID=2045280 RepID=A0A455SZV0_9CHLR|nr:hypothetical protein KTA_20860 [Thermogemmatispora argillosa]